MTGFDIVIDWQNLVGNDLPTLDEYIEQFGHLYATEECRASKNQLAMDENNETFINTLIAT